MAWQVWWAAHRDFAQSETLNLVRACAPVDLSHKAVPKARDKLGFGERTLFNNGAYSSDDLLHLSNEQKKRERKENDARRKVDPRAQWRL